KCVRELAGIHADNGRSLLRTDPLVVRTLGPHAHLLRQGVDVPMCESRWLRVPREWGGRVQRMRAGSMRTSRKGKRFWLAATPNAEPRALTAALLKPSESRQVRPYRLLPQLRKSAIWSMSARQLARRTRAPARADKANIVP